MFLTKNDYLKSHNYQKLSHYLIKNLSKEPSKRVVDRLILKILEQVL